MATYPTQYIIDPSSGYNTKPKLIVTPFGDSYQQVVPDGINNTDNSMTINHIGLSMSESKTLFDEVYGYARSGETVDFENVFDWDGVSAKAVIKIKVVDVKKAFDLGHTQSIQVTAQEVWE